MPSKPLETRARSYAAARGPGLAMILEHLVEALQDAPEEIGPTLSMQWHDSGVTLERTFLPGEGLNERIARGSLSVEQSVDIARAVLRGLVVAHERNVLHGAVDPNNIIIQEEKGTMHVVVTDWGEGQVQAPNYRNARYLSPEQTGTLDYEVGEWSDLYSVGIVLYEMLAGQPPFQAEKMGALLRLHLNEVPASIRSLGVEIPPALDEIVARLLQKDPRTRYRTAAGALVDLDLLAAHLQEFDPQIVVGQADRRNTLTEPSFLGRRQELQAMEAQLQTALAGSPALTIVEADSGGGKTRVLQELAHRAALQGFWVIHGQGQDQAAPLPYGVLQGIVTAIQQRMQLDDDATTLLQRLHDLEDETIAALPGLAPILSRDIVEVSEEHGAQRTVRALTHLLHALGTADRPAILLLDDMQWADGPSGQLLEEWWRVTKEDHLMVAVAFRSDEVDARHRLRALKPSHHCALQPFGSPEIHGLVTSMAGPTPPEVEAMVTKLANGNPFMASAALRGLVEAGTLVSKADGWQLDETWDAKAIDAQGIADFLLRRLERLPDDCRKILEVGAVLGKEFDGALAAKLSGLRAHAAMNALAHSRIRHILFATREDGFYAFTHDKLREAALASLPPDQRAKLHAAAAQQIQASHTEAKFDLAYHFFAAGEPTEAFQYAIAAAEEARRRLALDTAERYYLMAEAGLPAYPDESMRVMQGLGDTLMLKGEYEAAKPWFDEAGNFASTTLQQAELQGKVADLAFRRGDLPVAARELEGALRRLKQPAPGLGWMLLLLPYELLRQLFHTLFPGRLHRKRENERDLLIAQLYSMLAHVNWFMRGPIQCAWAHLREMNLLENGPPNEALGKAYAEHAVVMSAIPYNRRGRRYGDASLQLRRDNDHAWGQAHALHFGAISKLAAGHLEEAHEDLQESARIFERTGDLWQANNAGWILALVQFRLGDMDGAMATARRFYEQADRIHDVQNTALSLEIWVKAGGTGVTEEMVDKELERVPSDAQSREAAYQMASIFAMQQGNHALALTRMKQAYKEATRVHLRSDFVAPIPAYVATMLQNQIAQLNPWNVSTKKKLLRHMRRWIRKARLWAWMYPNNRAHVLRLRAFSAASKGHMRSAHRLVDRSLEEATTRNMVQEAKLCQALKLQLESSHQATLEESSIHLLGTSDRLDTLVEVGRTLAASVTEAEALAELRAATHNLLRSTQTIICPSRDDVPPPLQFLAQGETRVLEAPVGEYRSAIVVPLQVRDEIVAWLVSNSTQVQQAYGEAEVALTEFLRAMGSAAIEAARDVALLQDANVKLSYQASLLRSQTEALDQGMLLVDPEGKIVSYNSVFRAMWNLADDVLDAKDDERAIAAVLHEMDNPEDFLAGVRSMYNDPLAEARDQLQLKDGRVFVRYTAPVVGEAGEIHGRLWLFRDDTERIRAQDELLRSFHRMEAMDKMRTQFINSAAHELNTPLTPIRLQLHLIPKTGPLNEQQTQAWDITNRNILRLQNLVTDILDTARAQRDEMELHPTLVDMASIATDVLDVFKAQADKQGVRMGLETVGSSELRADGARLTQVFVNLVGNAMRYAETTVEVKIVRTQDAVEVSIRDDGVGMSKEELEQLFRPFSRPVASPDGKPQGTGLGLTICKGLVESHGGKIWAVSAGKGTEFHFLLPAS